MRAYAQSGQYHTIVESRVRLTMNCIDVDLLGYILAHLIKEECWVSFSQGVSSSFILCTIFQTV